MARMPNIEQDQPTAVDSDVVDAVRRHIDVRRERAEELQSELAVVLPELKRYERALQLLLNETPPPKPVGRPPVLLGRSKSTRISREKVEEIKATILAYAADHEEFRQIDIRTILDTNSNRMSTAFDILRQENVIRFARRDGNNKYYRLTAEALNAQQ